MAFFLNFFLKMLVLLKGIGIESVGLLRSVGLCFV